MTISTQQSTITNPLRFPRDLLHLLHWAFFKPFTLWRYIRQLDVENNASLITLWRHGAEDPRLREMVKLSLGGVLVVYFLLTLCIVAFLSFLGINFNWIILIIGGAILAILNAFFYSITSSIGFSPVIAAMLSVSGSIGYGASIKYLLRNELVLALSCGLVLGIMELNIMYENERYIRNYSRAISGSIFSTIVMGIVLSLLFGITSYVIEIPLNLFSFWIVITLTTFSIFTFGYFRLILVILELPCAWLLSYFQTKIHISPVYWDELAWFPLPGLERQLLAITRRDRQEGMEAIAFVAQSFRQGWAAERALLELAAEEVESARSPQAIAAIAQTLAWLPPKLSPELENFLPSLAQVTERVQASLESDTLYNRQTQYRAALQQLGQVRLGLASARRPLAQRLGPALQGWEAILQRELAALDQQESIPNVYVAGSPLMEASKLFKGRRDLFTALERELSTPAEQRPALLLFGARRSGKTSVLKQLPVRLGPNIIPVAFDQQAAAPEIRSAADWFERLAAALRTSAQLRRLELPHLEKSALHSNAFAAAQSWLSDVETRLEKSDRWVLLALDEYEYLGEHLEKGYLDEGIFQWLRGLIQHHPRFTLLFSGSHTLEDLPPLWSHYLINVRLLHIGALKPAEARELIERPIENFPLQYEPAAVERILAETGCQPLLIQATCRDLVNCLNEDERSLATLADAENALTSALTSVSGYFTDLYNGRDSDDAQRAVLRAAAGLSVLDGHSSGFSLDEGRKVLSHLSEETLRLTLRRLVHRDILALENDTYRFHHPLVARWIRERS